MKSEELIDAIDGIDESELKSAELFRNKKQKIIVFSPIIKYICIAACICLVFVAAGAFGEADKILNSGSGSMVGSVGDWEPSPNSAITEALRQKFEKAIEGQTDATYEPISLEGTKVVAGRQFMILAKKTMNNEEKTESYVYVIIYENVKKEISLTEIIDAPDAEV